MKGKLAVIAAAALCLAMFAGGTLAYFTTENTAHNVITTGNVSIEIIETTLTENGEEKPFPKDGMVDLLPGDVASKIVKVKNNEEKAWIRVRVKTPVITGKDGVQLPVYSQGQLLITPITHVDDTMQGSEPWLQGSDGWAYCKTPVERGSLTPALMEGVAFSPTMRNEYQHSSVELQVEVQAVQAANNGDTVLQAKGWPETPQA